MTPKIIYEVYDNRAVLQGIDGLPLLDRRTEFRAARSAAREWAGCVAKVRCEITSLDPFQRTVLACTIVYIFRPKIPKSAQYIVNNGQKIALTVKTLKTKLKSYDGRLNPYKRRKS